MGRELFTVGSWFTTLIRNRPIRTFPLLILPPSPSVSMSPEESAIGLGLCLSPAIPDGPCRPIDRRLYAAHTAAEHRSPPSGSASTRLPASLCGLADRQGRWRRLGGGHGGVLPRGHQAHHALRRRIRFEALQSDAGRKLLQRSGRAPDDISSVVLVEKDRSYIKSEAVARIMDYLQLPFPQLALFVRLVPLFVRDFAYDKVASNRYSLFGQSESCELQ
ncbi:hypothetical protein Taro_037547 [Colocasia esculenta]|uniref:DCC family protein n=1 Tax=Colocasia esculenta TaxID=4460 RepID=A0A843W0V3_COLES|nr:hypothetical protein [Colocasia esculenta]